MALGVSNPLPVPTCKSDGPGHLRVLGCGGGCGIVARARAAVITRSSQVMETLPFFWLSSVCSQGTAQTASPASCQADEGGEPVWRSQSECRNESREAEPASAQGTSVI